MQDSGSDEELQAEWDAVERRSEEVRAEAAKNVGCIKVAEDIMTVPIKYQEVQQWLSQMTVDPEVLRPLREELVAGRGGCCGSRQRSRSDVPNLSRKLQADKDLVLFLKCTEFDFNTTQHFRMLRTMYGKLTRNKVCPSIGRHWEDLGFQNTDPRMDLNRTGGVLNVLHLFFFYSHYTELFKAIYLLSNDCDQNFPLACVSINLTRKVIDALLSGRLSSLCGRPGSCVFDTVCAIHSGCLYYYYDRWRSCKRTINDNELTLSEAQTMLERRPATLLEKLAEGAKIRQNGDASQLEFTDLELGATKAASAKSGQTGSVPDRLKGYAAQ